MTASETTSSDENWVDIGGVDEFLPGQVQEVIVQGRVLAVARLNDGFFALDGLCPHQGGPLGKGKLAGDIVICPWHQFSFDMRTGYCTSSRGLVQPRNEVRILGARVVVQLGGD